MDTRFADSLWPATPPVILGRRLRPFCLWHALQIEALGDLPALEPSAGLGAVVQICAAGLVPYAAPRGLRGWLYRRRVRLLRRRPALRAALWREFGAYRAAAMAAAPRFWKSNGSRPCQAPWQLFIAARLVRYGGLTFEAAMALPIATALWRATALAEAGGAEVRLMTPADETALRAAGIDPDTL